MGGKLWAENSQEFRGGDSLRQISHLGKKIRMTKEWMHRCVCQMNSAMRESDKNHLKAMPG